LLEILAGREAADAGERALRKLAKMAYVPQDSLFGPEETVGSVLQAAMKGLPLFAKMLAEAMVRIEM
jgi:ATP-binding cassette subfamily F protein uup